MTVGVAWQGLLPLATGVEHVAPLGSCRLPCLACHDQSVRLARDQPTSNRDTKRAHPDLNQGPADLQSAALTTELCTQFAMLSREVAAMSALSAHSCSPCCVPPLAKPLRPTNTWWCPRPWWFQCQQPRLCLLRELPGRHECMAAWSSSMILA